MKPVSVCNNTTERQQVNGEADAWSCQKTSETTSLKVIYVATHESPSESAAAAAVVVQGDKKMLQQNVCAERDVERERKK